MRPKHRLIVFLIIVLAFICAYVISKFNDNTYYYLYPRFTYEYTWVVMMVTIIIGIGLIIIYIKKRAELKRKRFLYTIFVFFVLINTAFFIGSLQYLIYLSDQNSFKVDDDVKNYELNIEGGTLERIQSRLLTDRSVSLQGIKVLQNEKLAITEKIYSSLLTKKSNTVTSFLLDAKNIQFELKRIWTHIPEDPIKPDTTHTAVFDYYLEIQKNNHCVRILQKDKYAILMAKYFANPYVINREVLISAIKEYVLDLDKNIVILKNNKLLIEKRGMPLTQFAYDSLMKSLQQDPQIFKMLSLKSRVLHLIHLIIISLILIPFVMDLTEKWRIRS